MNWLNFQKPQRYLDSEWNVIKKKHRGKIKVAICFPDLYEVGMSNLGLRILYAMFNEFNDIVCERVFFPGLDLGDYLEKRKKRLFSLESKLPLSSFDVIGFNLSYELNFTNFLYMLKLGGVPLRGEERKKIILLGGGISNPEPLAEFVDVFFLGEFEEKIAKFVSILRKYKDKESRLRALAEIEGFYVPKFYHVEVKGRGYYFFKKYKYAHLPLKKIYVKDLNSVYYPVNWLTPHTEIVHDRVQIEIARGCPNRCYFCQARCFYYPYREKKVEKILKIMEAVYKSSGYENFSLLALSASDYSHIEELIEEAEGLFNKEKVGISLPSLRVEDLVSRLYKKLLKVKKTSLTLAIEAGTPQLRERINKRIDVDTFLEAKEILKSLNLRHIKLYFMFGLPGEGEQDLISIGELVRKIAKELNMRLHVSINVFVPKPFSLFQDLAMEPEDVLYKKRELLLKTLKRRNIKLSISNIKQRIIEAVLSRGDRRLSRVIYRAFLKGAKFDSYTEHFNWRLWEEAFREEELDYRWYLSSFVNNFSWSHINWRG